jgi:N-acetylmuramoyl-L-alanine amidase
MDRTHQTPRRIMRFPAILQTTLLVAALVATLFTAFPPKGLFSGNISEQLAGMLTSEPEGVVAQGTPLPQVRIGIVAGHYGYDSGAVCENGITEVEVNFKIATIVQQKLAAQGFQADLLEEFDPRLINYRAAALVSIHNDSCVFVNEQATGFKVAAAMSSRDLKLANRLALCLRDRYQRTTGLPWHDSITNDMTLYHAFDEISPNTPAAIIETGFLYKDYDLLTQEPDKVAAGVVEGILCFVNNESIVPVAP